MTVPPAPTAGVEQIITGPLFCVSETKFMLPGSMSCSEAPDASSGPALVAEMVNATSVSGPAEVGPLFDAPMSADGGGGVEVAARPLSFSSFGSMVSLEAVAMLTKRVPGGVAGGIWKTNVKSAEAEAARVPGGQEA